MIRRWVVAAAAVVALAACDQGSGPKLPQADANAQNAPSRQTVTAPTGQANLTAEQRAQLEGLVKNFLDGATQRFAQGMAPAPGFNDQVAALQPGHDDRWQVNLAGGTAYRILGACDNECSNLDIELIDSHGGVVASDVLPDDFPVVNFTPAANGTYYVRTMLQTCTVAPCYVGARILVNGPSGAPAPAKPS